MLGISWEEVLSWADENIKNWKKLIGAKIKHSKFGIGIINRITCSDKINILIIFRINNIKQYNLIITPMQAKSLQLIDISQQAWKQIMLDRNPQIATIQNIRQQESSISSPPKKYKVGDKVYPIKSSNRIGFVSKEPIKVDNEWYYMVFFGSDEIQYPEKELLSYDPILCWGGKQELLRDLAVLKIEKPLGDALYSMHASRTEFQVYQFKPVLKFLANPDQRLLIADEVGLGKTIEAGIIYMELRARLQIDRILIVCPSSLRHKWQTELKMRFDEDFAIYDSNSIRDFIFRDELTQGNSAFHGIVSLELIRRDDIAEAFRDIKFDLVIIDEAHHCRNTGTLANAVATTLAENSDAALMLTATPLQMRREDLFNLFNILAPGEFNDFGTFQQRLEPNQFISRAAKLLEQNHTAQALCELIKVENTSEAKRFLGNPHYKQIKNILGKPDSSISDLVKAQRRLLELNTLASVFTRTRRREVKAGAARRTASTLEVYFTPQEMKIYDQVLRQSRNEYRRGYQGNPTSGWISVMRERQVASCISAYCNKHHNDTHLVSAEDTIYQYSFSIGSELENEGAGEYEVSGRALNHYITTAPLGNELVAPTVDSKFDAFYEMLNRVLAENSTSKILVFSYFIDTIEYLHDRLSEKGIRCLTIHGRQSISERQEHIDSFKSSETIRILISSDVGSEGLDFQFCDTLFNYDLPWNPMKVEQRIGRIDRFGQAAPRVRIYNLVIMNTIEERILTRLYERINIFKESIGDIEVILGEQIRELTKAVFASDLSDEEQREKADLAARVIMGEKLAIEEFDDQRLQLLGQDSILNSTIEQTMTTGKYMSAAELHSLVESYLTDKFQITCLESVKGDDTFLLHAEAELMAELRSLALKSKGNQTISEFSARLNARKELPVTFSDELATARRPLEYITIRHPVAQLAYTYWKDATIHSKYRYRLSLKAPDLPSGVYFFFIYLLEARGIQSEYRFITVALGCNNLVIEPEVSNQLIRLLQTAPESDTGRMRSAIDQQFENAEAFAMRYAVAVRNRTAEEMQAMAEALVNARKAAVEQSYNAKRRRSESILTKVTNASIVRMHKSMLATLEARTRLKLEEIEHGRHVEVGLSLKLEGILELTQ